MEKKIMCTIKVVALLDQLGSNNKKEKLQTEDAIIWIVSQRWHWWDYVHQMDSSRITKLPKDHKPQTRRPFGHLTDGKTASLENVKRGSGKDKNMTKI